MGKKYLCYFYLNYIRGRVEILPAWRPYRRRHGQSTAQALFRLAHRNRVAAREARPPVVFLVAEHVARKGVRGWRRFAASRSSSPDGSLVGRCAPRRGSRRAAREKERRGAKLIRDMATQHRVLIVAEPAATVVLHQLPASATRGAGVTSCVVVEDQRVGLVVERGGLGVRLLVLLCVSEHAPVGVGGGGGGAGGLQGAQAQPHLLHGERSAAAAPSRLLLQGTLEH